jgi:hypothetical protein
MHLFIIYSVTRSKRIEDYPRIRCPICWSLIPAARPGFWISGLEWTGIASNAGMLVVCYDVVAHLQDDCQHIECRWSWNADRRLYSAWVLESFYVKWTGDQV